MENENTVEEMQDNNAIKQMRERIKELESAEKELSDRLAYKTIRLFFGDSSINIVACSPPTAS